MTGEYKAADVKPSRVEEVVYWIAQEPRFNQQVVLLDVLAQDAEIAGIFSDWPPR